MPTNVFDMQDTWNNVSVLFNAIKMNVNNAASAVGSKLLDLQTNGVSKFSVDPDGIAVAATPVLGDSSTKVATTEFVKAQGYAVLAGNNIYTGTNTFTNTTVADTQPTNDNSGLLATTAFVKSCLAAFQPLDADLSAISALGGTNTIYYRSGASAWSPVVIGANLTFAGGTLAAAGGGVADAEYVTAVAHAGLSAERVLTNTATITWDFATPGQAKANAAASGGNVSSSGTPTVNQYGRWVTATTIQGVAPATVLSDIGAVAKAGDTMTGGLTISGSTTPTLTLAPTSGSTVNAIVRQNGDTLVIGSAGFQFDLAASSFKTPINIRQAVDAAGYGLVVTGNAVATAGWIWEGAVADGYDTCFGSSNGGYTFCVSSTPADFLVRFRAAGSEIKTPCAFTVSPTTPTPAAGDNSTKVATTAFVRAGDVSGATPPVGTVGEVLTLDFANVALTTTANVTVGSLLITAGEWELYGGAHFIGSAAVFTTMVASVTTGSVVLTIATDPYTTSKYVGPAMQEFGFRLGPKRASLAGSATFNLVVNATFSATGSCSGYIRARRMK